MRERGRRGGETRVLCRKDPPASAVRQRAEESVRRKGLGVHTHAHTHIQHAWFSSPLDTKGDTHKSMILVFCGVTNERHTRARTYTE